MSDIKYGRLFTSEDVEKIVNKAILLQVEEQGTPELGRVLEEVGKLTFPAAEPQFTLRGQDQLALDTIEHYRHISENNGQNDLFLEKLDSACREFDAFGVDNPAIMKLAD